MKKIIIAAMALTCATAGFSADTVTSENIVGYNKVVATSLNLVSVDFDYSATNITPETIYGDTLPVGTKIFTFTSGIGYATSEYVESFGTKFWTATPALNGATAHWLAFNVGDTPVDPIYSGDVLLAEFTTNSIIPGLQLLSWPYPTAVKLSDMGIVPEEGDKVYTYDPAVGYATAEYVNSFGTLFWTADPVIKIGEGFWYSSNISVTNRWIATRPFTP